MRIFEHGIYTADTGYLNPVTRLKPVTNARLLQATSSIPGRLGLRFGIRYVLQGSPIAARVPIEIVTRYPLPGIQRGAVGPVTEHRYEVQIGIGVPQYADFQFDESEELVSGVWVIEVWHAGRKMRTQRFCVSVEIGEVGTPCQEEIS